MLKNNVGYGNLEQVESSKKESELNSVLKELQCSKMLHSVFFLIILLNGPLTRSCEHIRDYFCQKTRLQLFPE